MLNNCYDHHTTKAACLERMIYISLFKNILYDVVIDIFRKGDHHSKVPTTFTSIHCYDEYHRHLYDAI